MTDTGDKAQDAQRELIREREFFEQREFPPLTPIAQVQAALTYVLGPDPKGMHPITSEADARIIAWRSTLGPLWSVAFIAPLEAAIEDWNYTLVRGWDYSEEMWHREHRSAIALGRALLTQKEAQS